jgi:hypothetical protein
MPSKVTSILPNTDIAITPSGYRLKGVTLTNHRGNSIDIQPIVTDFSITESIYTPFLTASFTIKDIVNFIEEFQLSGYEKITVSISRTEPDKSTSVELDFFVVEYPMYGRGQQNTQVYKISAITEHGYVSKMMSICRSFKDSSGDAIKKIIEDDLKVKTFQTKGTITSNFSGVIPYMNPLDASAFLLRRTTDSKSSPCFLYQTLDNKVTLATYTSMITEKVYDTYYVGSLFKATPNTPEEFKERKTRILSMASDFRMSKVIPTALGAFASETAALDLTTKAYVKHMFNYKTASLDKDSITGKSLLSSKYDVDLSTKSAAARHFIPVAASTYNDATSYNESAKKTWGITNAKVQNLDSAVHDLELHGDLELNAGKMIEIKIPLAIEPGSRPDVLLYDKLISGKYMVTSVIHTFTNEYYIQARIKRDSSGIDL